MRTTPASPLADRARGRWAGILPLLGVDSRYLRNKHGPCPICGGKDRYRWDDKDGRGSFFCSGPCGAGDGFKLAMLASGLEFRDVAKRVEELVGAVPRVEPPRGRTDNERRDALNRLWRSSSPVRAGDPVSLWLARRVGEVGRVPGCLRYHPRIVYRGEEDTHHPAMIALVTGTDGRAATLHRTYLTKGGEKAAVERPRKLMEGGLPKGSSVRLGPYDAALGIAEGIETAFAASELFSVPCWAALTAGNLAQWVPPDGVRDVVVFGDSDLTYTGQAAAYALANRLSCNGVSVRVELPDQGQDWNDVLQQQKGFLNG